MRWCRNIIAYSEILRTSVPCKLWVNGQCLYESNWVYCSSFFEYKGNDSKVSEEWALVFDYKKIFIINKIFNLH